MYTYLVYSWWNIYWSLNWYSTWNTTWYSYSNILSYIPWTTYLYGRPYRVLIRHIWHLWYMLMINVLLIRQMEHTIQYVSNMLFLIQIFAENVVCEMASILSRPQCVNVKVWPTRDPLAWSVRWLMHWNSYVKYTKQLVKLNDYMFDTGAKRVHWWLALLCGWYKITIVGTTAIIYEFPNMKQSGNGVITLEYS